jgi:uncharacterized protein (TIGR02147 family)
VIFSYTQYRDFLRASVKESPLKGSRLTFSTLAVQSGLQNSYLSKVMAGLADLNLDQAARVADTLALSNDEAKYFELLVDHERCSFKKRKDRLKREIQKIQDQENRTERHLKESESVQAEQMSAYYMDPILAVIHISMGIELVARNPLKVLPELLGTSSNRIQEALKSLESLGMIRFNAQKQMFERARDNIHLSKDDSLYPAWRRLTRLESLSQIAKVPRDKTYGFSVTFASTPEVRSRVQEAFMEFLKQAQELVQKSKAECTYQMDFDLFPWIET